MTTIPKRKFAPQTFDNTPQQQQIPPTTLSAQHRARKQMSQQANKSANTESGYHSSHELNHNGVQGDEYNLNNACTSQNMQVHVDGKPIRLQLSDTAGQNDLDTLRPLCYKDCDVFLLCFSVVSPSSFYNLATQWVPEIKSHLSHAKMIVCGTQTDLRSNVQLRVELRDYGESPVSEQEGREYAQEIGAAAYVECSSLTQHRLKEVFDQCILVGLPQMQSRVRRQQRDVHRGSLHRIKDKIRAPSQLTNTFTPVKHDKTHSRLTSNSTPSLVMIKRQNSQTRLNEIHRDISPQSATVLTANESIVQAKKQNKIKQGWQRFLCMTGIVDNSVR